MIALVLAAQAAFAERLPVQSYGSADGLPATFVNSITSDSRGLLWFCTRDGLTRFDGTRFVTYGVQDGLPTSTINHLLEARDGTYWIGTNGRGVSRLDPRTAVSSTTPGGPKLLLQEYLLGVSPSSNRVNVLLEDRQGHIWAGTDAGLFRADPAQRQPIFHEIPLGSEHRGPASIGVRALLLDRHGTLWIGTTHGVLRQTGHVDPASFQLVLPAPVYALSIDEIGRLWIGSGDQLIVTGPGLDSPGSARPPIVPEPVGLPFGASVKLAAVGDVASYMDASTASTPPFLAFLAIRVQRGHVWLSTPSGLVEYDGRTFRLRDIGPTDGAYVLALGEDAAGNLWGATSAGTAFKITRSGFVSYGKDDGLADLQIRAMAEDRMGRLFVVAGDWQLHRFDSGRFTAVRPALPPDATYSWGSQVAYLDRRDRWWFLTNTGIAGPAPAGTQWMSANTPPNLPSVKTAAEVVWLLEDVRGDFWMATRVRGQPNLLRWRRGDRPAPFRADEFASVLPRTLAEDQHGALWVGLDDGVIARVGEEHVTRLEGAHTPGGVVTAFHLDLDGRLWAGTSHDGLLCIEDPALPSPRVKRFSTGEGLASSNVRSVTSDRWGRIYAATASGIDRLDPATGRVVHYTTIDGIASGLPTIAYRDRTGDLWFGTLHGLSRLTPERDTPHSPPHVLIGSVRVAGKARLLSPIGERTVAPLTVEPTENEIAIEFFGIGFAAGEALRYQFRVDGLDRDWSAPTRERVVHYGHLPAGPYRFQVRAVSAHDIVSDAPATVDFVVRPEIWQRTWFRALALALLAGLVYAAHRLRLARLLALERVRTRIASDLHDDIGATLAQIAVLSEVVQSQVDDSRTELQRPLARIATASREAVSSLGDIVWAINPQKDTLGEVLRRMRRFAAEVLPPRGIEFDLTGPGADVHLGADSRRQLYLIFKESLNNVLKHSGCTHVSIALQLHHRQIVLTVADNGRGFDPARESEGHGLKSMARRAAAMSGALDIRSTPGGGSKITLSVPYDRRR